MSAAKAALPIAPVRTGGVWTFDFLFYTDRALTSPEDWSGRSAVLAMVPRSEVMRDKAFKLTSALGDLVMLDNGVGVRVGSAGTKDLTPAVYDFELSWLDADDEATRVLVGSVSIEQGLDEIVDGEPVTGPIAISGGVGQVVKAFVPAGVVQVVQGVGVQGAPGLTPEAAAEVILAGQAAQDAAALASTKAALADEKAGLANDKADEASAAAQSATAAAAAANLLVPAVAPLAGGAAGKVFAWFGPGDLDYGWVASRDAVPIGPGLHVRPAAHGAATGDNWVTALTLGSALASALPTYLRSDDGAVAINDVLNTLVVSGGGASATRRAIGGFDRFGVASNVTLQGVRQPYPAPRAGSGTAIDGHVVYAVSADYVTFTSHKLRDVARAWNLVGNRVGLVIDGLDLANFEYGVTNFDAANVLSGTLDTFTIRNFTASDFQYYFIRLGSASNGLIENGVIDGLTQTYSSIPAGLNFEAGCHDITIKNVLVKGIETTTTSAGSFWNGDCFVGETGYNLHFVDCTADGSPDGGFDFKCDDSDWTRCIAKDNKENYKLWGTRLTLTDVQSLNPRKRGGTGGAYDGAHFQFAGQGPAEQIITLVRPYVRGEVGKPYPVFQKANAGVTTVLVKDADIIIDPDTPLTSVLAGTLNITWDPPLPTQPVFNIAWRAGFTGGIIPAATAPGTVVADVNITSGAGNVSVINGGGLLTAVGTTLVTGALPANGGLQVLTVRVAPSSGVTKADKLVALIVPAPAQAQATALLARMTTPAPAYNQTLINTTVALLISSGIWAATDEIGVPYSHDIQAAKLGWKGVGDFTTVVGAPTWSAAAGLSGSASAYWAATIPAVARTRDSCHAAVYTLNNNTATGDDIRDGAASQTMRLSCRSGTSVAVRMSGTIEMTGPSSWAAGPAFCVPCGPTQPSSWPIATLC